MEENAMIDDFTDEDKVETGNFFKFENAEDSVIGILKEISEGTYGQQYLLDIGNDELVTVGSYSGLNGKITADDVGRKIKIVYTGDTKSKNGRMYKGFAVFKK